MPPKSVSVQEKNGDPLRKLITDDRLVPDREDVLALIDYHHDNPVKMQDFLQHLDAGIPYQYISNRLLPELGQEQDKVCLSYPEEKEEKKLLHGTGGHDRRN